MTARSISPFNPAIGAAKGRILILASDRSVAAAVRAVAEARGFQVVGICANPREGVQAVQEMRPNLVVSGIFFDGEPYGIELSRDIQEEQGVPVVFIGQSEDPLLMLQIAMVQPAGYVSDARDAGYLEAVLNRALKGVRTTVSSPF
jgi:DNA-binding NarL/FixJ family response regulator